MKKIMTLAALLAIVAAVSVQAAETPAQPAPQAGAKAGKGGGKGGGFGQWKKNPENVKRFDKNNDGVLGEDEKKEAQAAWKKETGRGEEKGEGCGKEGKKDGCTAEQKPAAPAAK